MGGGIEGTKHVTSDIELYSSTSPPYYICLRVGLRQLDNGSPGVRGVKALSVPVKLHFH